MKKNNYISLILLFVFSFVLVHNVIPHHHHDDISEINNHEHHHDKKEQDHHNWANWFFFSPNTYFGFNWIYSQSW